MTTPDPLAAIFERIAEGEHTQADIAALQQALRLGNHQGLVQVGKYNVNIGEGQDIQIGDRTYVTWNDEAIQALIEVVQKLQSTTQTPTPQLASVDELVQQVRSRLHYDIQCLHGTMPLWAVDRWVPLGELFVDVNILEELSSSRKLELDDLWQDFTTGMQGYSSERSLDRIGLGKKRKRVSGLEVLAKNMNLMVVGKPGSGKTTYLQRVVTECNAGNLQVHRIPVLIKLREYVEDGLKVDYSLESYLKQCWKLSDTETQLVLEQGQALVLLDGLDEVTGDDGNKIAKEIKQFARAYPQVQVIVTCRTQSHKSRFERFDYVEVADFNESQVQAFAQHWFKTVMGDESAGLARALEFLGLLFLQENKPIRELAITPILLSLTCAVFHQTGKFYSKRSKLYEEGLELLLEQWDKSRSIERDEIYRDLSVERKLELLSYLAVKKFEQPQYVLFEQAEIERYIAEFLEIGEGDSQGVLRAIESQHGVLIQRAQKIWSFSHLTFQEYLVAKWFSDGSKLENIFIHFTEPRWRLVFIMLANINVNAVGIFFLKMIEERNNIIQGDRKIDKFLKWINKKASENKNFDYTNFDYTISIRLFYFFIGLKTNIVYSPSRVFKMFLPGLIIFLPFFYILDLILPKSIKNIYSRPLESSIKKIIYFIPFYNPNYRIETLNFIEKLDLDKLNINYSGSLFIENELTNILEKLLTVNSDANSSDDAKSDDIVKYFNIEIEKFYSAYTRAVERHPSREKLILKLRNMRTELPYTVDSKISRSLFVSINKNSWYSAKKQIVKKLRKFMMKHLNIGHDWKFNSKQKDLLHRYYLAVHLILDCFQEAQLSKEKKKEIQEDFLRTSAEFKKHKSKKKVD